MSPWKGVFAATGLAIGAGSLALILTNPDQRSYEDYATGYAQKILQKEICNIKLTFLGTNITPQDCRRFILDNQVAIRQIISQGTRRQNYGLFSIYTTTISVSQILPFIPAGLLPPYQAKTIGVFQSFHVYQTH